MSNEHDYEGNTADRELKVTRVFDAPRDLVFRMWTEPEHLARWWGPDGFTNTIHEMDVRPGGELRFTMHAPDGTDFANKIVYSEVDAPQRLVYLHSGEGEDEGAPFKVTVTFAARGSQTEIVMRAVFATREEFEAVKKMGATEGAQQTLARLAQHLTQI